MTFSIEDVQFSYEIHTQKGCKVVIRYFSSHNSVLTFILYTVWGNTCLTWVLMRKRFDVPFRFQLRWQNKLHHKFTFPNPRYLSCLLSSWIIFSTKRQIFCLPTLHFSGTNCMCYKSFKFFSHDAKIVPQITIIVLLILHRSMLSYCVHGKEEHTR